MITELENNFDLRPAKDLLARITETAENYTPKEEDIILTEAGQELEDWKFSTFSRQEFFPDLFWFVTECRIPVRTDGEKLIVRFIFLSAIHEDMHGTDMAAVLVSLPRDEVRMGFFTMDGAVRIRYSGQAEAIISHLSENCEILGDDDRI